MFSPTSPSNVVILPHRSILKHGAETISWHFGTHDMVQGGPHDTFDLFQILMCGGDWDLAVREARKMLAQESAEATLLKGGRLYQIREARKHGRPRLELIQYFCREKDVFVVTGDSGLYKTFLLLDAAFAGATGLPFLNKFAVCRFQSVVILTESQEDDDAEETDGYLQVKAEATFDLIQYEDGNIKTELVSDEPSEWEPDAPMRCRRCQYEGAAAEFDVEDPTGLHTRGGPPGPPGGGADRGRPRG
jgi:hypothetical protein